MLVSVCMIVKNEEEILPRAINSTIGLADEVIVVDTGSTDNTVEVARELDCQVFTNGDHMHKAKSRNLAMSKANGDWIIILDADETIEKPLELREYLQQPQAQAVYIRLAYVDGNDNHTLSYQQMRIWRRDTYRYKYRAHELPVPVKDWGNIGYTDFVWQHRPPSNRTWKLDYTLQRLLLDVEENSDDGRPLYYLGRQYMYLKKWQEAINTTDKYLVISEGGIDRAEAYANQSTCYSNLNNIKKQTEYLIKATAEQPDKRDWWALLGELFYNQNRNELASGMLKNALSIPPPTSGYYNHHWYGSYIYDLLARALWKQGQYEEGYEYASKAVKLSSDDTRLKNNLSFFESKLRLSKFKSQQVLSNPILGKNVLLLCNDDCAGVAHKTFSAIRDYSDNTTRLVSFVDNYLHYPKDIFQPSEDDLQKFYDWADIIHIFSSYPQSALRTGKPTVITYNGSHYRRDPDRWNKEHSGFKQLCTTIDLTQYGPQWMPVPIDDIVFKDEPTNGRWRVSHAPTNRWVKDTEAIARGLNELDIDLDIIEGVDNDTCLSRKAQSQIHIDQFKLGYGVNALECWQMGIPVIANAEPEIISMMEEQIGYLPFVKTELDKLSTTVSLLMEDKGFYQESKLIGQKYVREFHSPEKVVQLLDSIYDEL